MKIRAVTVGSQVHWPPHSDALDRAGELARTIRDHLAAAGWEVQTTRLATPALNTIPDDSVHGAGRPVAPAAAIDLAAAVEAQALDAGFDYLALGAIDTLGTPASTWQPLLDAVLDIIRRTERVFCSALVASRPGGINLEATRVCGELVARIASQRADGFGNLRFAALANCPPDIPFFPAAYHDGSDRLTVGLALEAADLIVAAFSGAASLDEARERLVATFTDEVQRLKATVEAAVQTVIDQEDRQSAERAARHPDKAHLFGGSYGSPVQFGGIDLSPAPFPAHDRSIAHAFERLGLPAFGAHGTVFLASMLTECLQRVSEAVGQAPRFGFSGLMLPVLEDSTLAARAAEGTFGVDSLLLYSTVCGLGLDTVPLPGDTPPGELAAIILDLAALAVRLDKPLTARLFPVPGKRAGDPVSWDFAFFAPSRVLPVRGLAPRGLLAGAARYNAAPGEVR